jgi:membrane-associated protein
MPAFLHLDLPHLIEAAGYLGLFCILFAETGLFFGFFLPGDSLLFTAGILAARGELNILVLVVLLSVAAILGDSVGYWFGRKTGPALFSREDSFFFHKKHLERTRHFYAKYGPRAVILARLIPVVRTFAPIFAGIGEMPYHTFFTYNVIGGVIWAAGFTLLGFFLGAVLPSSVHLLLPISAVIIVLSFMPILWELYRSRARE